MKYKLFVFDVDGTLTLLNHKKDPRLIDFFERLILKGIKIAFLSGRLPNGMVDVANFYNIPEQSLIVGGDGVVFSYFQNNKIEIDSFKTISEEISFDILSKGYPGLVLTPSSIIVMGNVGLQMQMLAELTSPICIDSYNYEDTMKQTNNNIVGIRYLLPKQQALKLLQEIPNDASIDVEIFDNAEFSIDVIGIAIRPVGMNKGSAIKTISEKYKVDLMETISFGDWVTDIPMLKKSGFSIVPKDSFAKVKQASKKVSKYSGKEGWVYEELKSMDWLL